VERSFRGADASELEVEGGNHCHPARGHEHIAERREPEQLSAGEFTDQW
jgi:hypothetical protein